MECTTVKKMMSAWIDGELAPDERRRMTEHMAQCSACHEEAQNLQQLSAALETLPTLRAPKGFTTRTLRAFRAVAENPGFAQRWRNLSFAMQGAACAVVLAGLLFGAVLGTSFTTLDNGTDDPYQTLYVSQGILP